ncbi:hypothetical protein M409DRAFT_67527 [Zasmidium cellare ATCC 36951]|uniref:Amino acid permease/ SLC12A domain-containing protein n=1 Tax=Zasmidium cellare ATCC 36951 TaxID=1080233 RepID=A0A6A6CH75_ZASCE|nr:uncharacterized protein M409DRAFT_67527 [Zasmidium cellare ATCC 36951]KAF2164776.1 hypothetical protein M409DRAFT_67527 [Zasmidium cellare ATCC 36951]
MHPTQQRSTRKQEIQKDFRHLATIGFTSLVMGTWEILLTANLPALANGGTSTLFWSMIWCYIGQLFVVLSLAELSSMVPMTGGQYQWVSVFAPLRFQKPWAYFSGWLCSIGWQSRFTADCYIVAGTIQALIDINHDLKYEKSPWHQGLLTVLVAIVISAFNALAAGHLSIAEGFFAVCHVFAFVPIVVSLWVLGPVNSAREVLLNFTDHGGGWRHRIIMPLVGQISSMFVVQGSDAVVHIADEVDDAGVLMPQCMLWAFLLNVPMTLIMLVTLCFNVGDVDDAVNGIFPPFVSIFKFSFRSVQATTAFTIVILCLLVMIAVSTMVATSRHLFAFGREVALYYPSWFSKVNVRFKVPLNAILSTTFFATLVALATMACSEALNTMIGLSVCCLMTTYMASIGSLIWRRLRREELLKARWSLGRAGLPVTCAAFLYCAWCFFWSFWPRFHNVSGNNFQWTSLLFSVVVLLMVLCYRGGRKRKRSFEFDDSTYTLQPMPLWNGSD